MKGKSFLLKMLQNLKPIKRKLKPIKRTYKRIVYSITKSNMRKRLKNTDFSIISDNCWGGRVYEELGLPYRTPFIGLYIFFEDYVKLLKNFRKYMEYELTFTNNSKWNTEYDGEYPIGILKDIELHFLHYANQEEAYEKWNKRKNRINYENIFFKMNDDNKCSLKLLKEFDTLDLKNKIIFAAFNYKELDNLIHFTDPRGNGNVGTDLFYYDQYFDVVNWLNGETQT